jgi:Na+-driven multidrug efflux pump
MAGRSAFTHTAGLSTSTGGLQTAMTIASWANKSVDDAAPPPVLHADSPSEDDEEAGLLPAPGAAESFSSQQQPIGRTSPGSLASRRSSSEGTLSEGASALSFSAHPPAAQTAASPRTPLPRQASQRKVLKGSKASSSAPSSQRDSAGVLAAAAAVGCAAVPATPVRVRTLSSLAVGVAASLWSRLGHSVVGRELQALLPMAAPVVVSSCLTQLLNIVDLMFVGNFLGTEYLAAAALGNCWFNILSALFLGGSSGIDKLCSSASDAAGGGTPLTAAGAPSLPPLARPTSPVEGGGAALGGRLSGRERGRGYTVVAAFSGVGMSPMSPKAAAPGPTSFGLGIAGGGGGSSGAAAGKGAGESLAAEGDEVARVWAHRGVFLMCMLSIPIMLLLSLTEEFLVIFGGQDVDTSFVAAGFCDSLVLGVTPLVVSTALGRYLGSQGIVWPGITVDLIANILNVSLNAALIKQDGFLGAPLATSVSRVAHLGMIVAYVGLRKPAAHQQEQLQALPLQPPSPLPLPPPPLQLRDGSRSREAPGSGGGPAPAASPPAAHSAAAGAREPWWDAKGLGVMASAMASGAFIVALESWPLELSNLIAGRLDVPSLDAHTVMLNTCIFISLGLPMGVGVAASSRIPALLSAGDGVGARKTALVSILSSLTYNMAAAIVLLAVRGHMGGLFSDDEEVSQLCAHTALIAALFQLVDGTQCVLACVLRGLEWGGIVTALLFFGWTAIGLPLAWFLAFHIGGDGWGIFGLWVGLLVGVASILLSFFVIYRTIDWDAEAKRALETRRWQEEQRAGKP